MCIQHNFNVDKHLSSFQCRALENNVAMNILILLFLLGAFLRMEPLGHEV